MLGDRRCIQPQLISEPLLRTFKELAELAPDHVPQLIDTIETVSHLYPDVPQAACFDSEFHSRMPRTSQMYALPRRFFDEGIWRYGFHGLSCEYIMQELMVLDPDGCDGRVIIAHLGNGSSVTAVDHGVSIDTSMGLTPMAGLVMGTRCGDLDPGIVALSHESTPHDIQRTERRSSIKNQAFLAFRIQRRYARSACA